MSLHESLSKKAAESKAKLALAGQKVEEKKKDAKDAPRDMASQVKAAKEVQVAIKAEEDLAAKITHAPYDVMGAMRLERDTLVVISWVDKENSQHACAGKIIGGNKKDHVHMVGWPSEGGTMGLMLVPDTRTGGRRLIDPRTSQEYVLTMPNRSEQASIQKVEAKNPLAILEVKDHVRVTYGKEVQKKGFDPGAYCGIVSKKPTPSRIEVDLIYEDGDKDTGKYDLRPSGWFDTRDLVGVESIVKIEKSAYDRYVKGTKKPATSKASGKQSEGKATSTAMGLLKPTERFVGNGPVLTLMKGGKNAGQLRAEGKKTIRTKVKQPNVQPQRVKVSSRIVPRVIQQQAIKQSQAMAALARKGAEKRKARQG